MSKTPIGLLEQDQLLGRDADTPNYECGSEILFNLLIQDGVQFFELQGGFSPSGISKTVVSLKSL